MISWSTTDVAGVEFGDTHVAVAHLRGRGDGPFTLTHAGWAPYDVNAPAKAVAAVLRKLWETAKIPTRTVCSAIRSGALVMRHFKIPAMSQVEMEAALELQAEEALQLAGDKVVVDWHLNLAAGGGNASNGFIEGVMTAVPSADVRRQLDILHAAALDPVIVDVRALAVANLYAVLESGAEAFPVCLINLAPHSADVLVMAARDVTYPHTVYCRSSTWAENPPFLAENVRDVLRFSQYKLEWAPTGRVLLAGRVPPDPEFVKTLADLLRMRVEAWDPLERLGRVSRRVRAAVDGEPALGGALVASLGLALRRG